MLTVVEPDIGGCVVTVILKTVVEVEPGVVTVVDVPHRRVVVVVAGATVVVVLHGDVVVVAAHGAVVVVHLGAVVAVVP